MQNNLFYLSGPHGCGKTTLGNELIKYNPQIEVPELFSRNVKFNTDPDYRQLLKICGRAIENFEYLEIAKQNPDKIIIANRCIYDVMAYDEVYLKHDWISDEKSLEYTVYVNSFFPGDNNMPNSIVLNPPLEIVMRHLESRWQMKGKKWMEGDREYARLACGAYVQFKDYPNVLYIDHEIDLKSTSDIHAINDWMMSIYEQKKILLPLEMEMAR